MYRSGREFEFDFSNQVGSYKGKLQSLENETKHNLYEMENHKDSITLMKVQTDNLKRELKESCENTRSDLSDDLIRLEERYKVEFNKQKTKNVQLNQNISELKKETTNVRNLLIELKRRMADLQLRVGEK
jgi:chromosome segregation ATPase